MKEIYPSRPPGPLPPLVEAPCAPVSFTHQKARRLLFEAKSRLLEASAVNSILHQKVREWTGRDPRQRWFLPSLVDLAAPGVDTPPPMIPSLSSFFCTMNGLLSGADDSLPSFETIFFIEIPVKFQ